MEGPPRTMPAPMDPSKKQRFRPLPGRCNVEYVAGEGMFHCRAPGCGWAAKCSKVAATYHVQRAHGGQRCHVFQQPTAADHIWFQERMKRRQTRPRAVTSQDRREEPPAQDAVGSTVVVPFPCEVQAPRGADGLQPGKLLGIRCVRQGGVGGLTIPPSIDPTGQEAVQVCVTWVAAHLAALQRWLGGGQGASASSRRHRQQPPLLWRPGEEFLYVSVSEVRNVTHGRSLAAAVLLSAVCMATGRCIKAGTAVTGDIDLRGYVLDVCGLEAKLVACEQRQITSLVLPEVSLARLRAQEKGAWPERLRRYYEGEGLALVGVTNVVELLQAAIEGCPPLPPDVQACLLSRVRPVVGLGYASKPQAGIDGEGGGIMVQACLRQPGSGQVVFTGHARGHEHGQQEPPGRRVTVAVHEARAWVCSAEQTLVALLGPLVGGGTGDEGIVAQQKGSLHSKGKAGLPCAGQDLHLHVSGGWDGADTSLLGGAIAVALVSMRLHRLPRPDVAVLGALTLAGQLLPSEKFGPEHVVVLRSQGFRAVVVTDAQRMLSDREAAMVEMEKEGVDLWATAPHQLLLLPLLPRIFGQGQEA